jgi:23S rRNA pseudouridine1911/1915/1917 synthase
MRLDHFLTSRETGPSRSRLKKLIEGGHATVDGAASRPSHKLKAGSLVALDIPPPEPLSATPEEIPLNIVFEDEHLVIVNKPQGLVVHPAPGHPSGTLVNGILWGRHAAGGDPLRPGIVHRLDKDTSGLMVIAKNEETHAHLAAQFHDHTVDRAYHALVIGSPPDAGRWDTWHSRHPVDRKRFTTKTQRGKRAVSLYEVVERFADSALLEIVLKTGRTHQVRVHCHDHGFPVLGDRRYPPRHLSPILKTIHEGLPGQALHARLLGFVHPANGTRLRFETTPPQPFTEALEALRA